MINASRSLLIGTFSLLLFSCEKESSPQLSSNQQAQTTENAVFLLLDEDAIDNGNEPNKFPETDVNDQLATVGQRKVLDYFSRNIGKTIDLYSGQVGDEGWYAKRSIPTTWVSAGPNNIGARNFLQAGPGLGSAANGSDDNKEILLDKIPNVTPLRAKGLAMLTGRTVVAVVYDGDVNINYSPLQGNLMGANLGVVAFDVVKVTERTDGSTSSLPRVTVTIRDAREISGRTLLLFNNAPAPKSSGEPFDIKPPTSIPAIDAVPAQ